MSSQNLVFFLIILLGILTITVVSLVCAFQWRKHLNTYKNWFNTQPDPVIVLDQHQRILNINPAAERLTGLTNGKLTKQRYQDVFPNFAEKFKDFTAGKQEPLEIQLEVAGQTCWYQLHILPLRERNNHLTGTLVVLQDISKNKRLESALEASHELYRSVTEQADDGIAIIQNDLIVYVNSRILAMTGYLPGDMLYRSFEFFIPPEHVEEVRTKYVRRVEGETTPILFETTIKRQDGTSLPVEIKIGLMTFESKPAALAMIQDISRRKQAEKQLRLQSEAMQAAANALVITDISGTIEWVNPAFIKMTGYTFDEVKGQNPRLLKSGKHGQEFYRHLWETIKAGRVWKGELVNQRKDGKLYDEQMTIAPVKDESGEITYFVAVKENITERKRAEKALRRSEHQFRELVWNTPVPMKVYGNDHTLILVNWRFTMIFGYRAEEIPTIEHWWTLAFPDETLRRQIKEEWLDLFKRGPVESSGYKPIEAEVTCKDGTIRDVRFSLVPLEDKYIVTLMDRTKQKRAERHLRQRARHSLLLNEITLSALKTNDLEILCQGLADRLGELLDADGCYIVLWDVVNQQAVPMAAYGPMRNTYRTIARPAEGEPTLTEAVLRTGRAIAVEDVFNSPYTSARIATKFPTRSMLGLPLIANLQKLGAALISYENSHAFTRDEIERGEQAAAQIALAIAKVKLFESEREKHQLARALVEISTLLSTNLNVKELLTRMLELIQRVVPYDAGNVFVIEEGQTKVLFTRGYNRFGKELDEIVLGMEFEIANTPNLRKVVETSRPVIIPDTAADPDWIRHKTADYYRSWAGVPIHINRRVIAIFSLEKQEPNFFRQEHVERLAAFAGQVAIVLENARLFEEIRQMAILDSLTGAFTRRHILDSAIQETERAYRYGHAMCGIMLDIDHFKKTNDSYGHQAGDLVLQEVIAACMENLRKFDLIGRYGGEEFLILLPETELSDAFVIAERIRDQIEKIEVESENGTASVTVSMGVSSLEMNTGYSSDELLKHLIYQADQALYKAKELGRNRVEQHPMH